MRALRMLGFARVPARKSRYVDGFANDAVAHDRGDGADSVRIAIGRCVLCVGALLALLLDRSVMPNKVLGYGSLAVYAAYSLVLLRQSVRVRLGAYHRLVHWIDVMFCVFLVGATGGTTSVFFYLFFFSILVAAFSYGNREGLAVTCVAAMSFFIVGYFNNGHDRGPPFDRLFMGAGYILLFGYVVSYWGGRQLLLNRQLRLLQDVNNLWNPRFGVEHTIGVNLDRLLDFYGADNCILIASQSAMSKRYLMYSASRTRRAGVSAPVVMTRDAVLPFLRLPENRALLYTNIQDTWLRTGLRCVSYEGDAKVDAPNDVLTCQALETLLDACSFLTAPYAQRDGRIGRIYITSNTKRFAIVDMEFLLQFTSTMSPVVENLQLMGELISKASEHERYKISRDIHDTTIQPYIGLKLGLEALSREQAAGERIEGKLHALIEMTNTTIQDLRAYAANLREETPVSGDFLVAAIEQQAERYRRFYGVTVKTSIDLKTALTGMLAAEVFQIVTEALANIVKHTTSRRAFVAVSCERDALVVKIGNELQPGRSPEPFEPRTIKERAQALGGGIHTEPSADGHTIVHVNVPLAAR